MPATGICRSGCGLPAGRSGANRCQGCLATIQMPAGRSGKRNKEASTTRSYLIRIEWLRDWRQRIILARGRVAITPLPSGTFLAGITRSRVIQLLYDAREIVKEAVVTLKGLLEADEFGQPENLLGLWARVAVATPCTSPYLWVSFISMRRLRRFPISS
jgi:hypothetical protein